MRASRLFFPTLRKIGAEAELASNRLLVRGGFIRQLIAGVYSFLPLGWRVLRRIEQIVREEMDRAGAQELLLPALQPRDLWERMPGKLASFGPELMQLTDRNDRELCLGPSHEEVITHLVTGEIRSYRELPKTLYQIQVKFRDQSRPRGGLIRAREFLMKDAYSFDSDWDSLDRSYDVMVEAYHRILSRCEIPYRTVDAPAGPIGGRDTLEFQLVCEAGEDRLLLCSSCEYGATPEQADFLPLPAAAPTRPGDASREPLTRVATPDQHTVDQVTAFLGVPASRLVKTLLYVADGRVIAGLVRGDHDLNEEKLRAAAGASKLTMADAKQVEQVSRAPVGFAGPVGLEGVELFADEELKSLANFVTGANEADAHLVNVNFDRDFKVTRWARLRCAQEGDPCPRCGRPLEDKRGIELAHVFKLGTKYSEALGATFTDQEGERKPFVMGCYGLGISRMMAAIAERWHDDDGLSWPREVAPFAAVVLVMNQEDGAQAALGEEVAAKLEAMGVEVLLDDREERPGVKFKDADLIGIPLQVVVGRKAAERQVEFRVRRDRGSELLAVEEAIARAAAGARGDCSAKKESP